jgi:hypothetical protein
MAEETPTPIPQVVQVNPAPVQVAWDLAKYLDNLGSRMDSGIARIEAKLDTKADKADLAGINARLDEHGKEIGRLKDRQREDEAAQLAVTAATKATTDSRQRRWNLLLAAALVVVSAFSTLAVVLHW